MSNTIEGLGEIEYWISWLSQSFAMGKWRSYFLGRGYDFQGIVPYRDDPDLVRMNWQASLTSGRLMVNTFSEERNARVYLLGNLGPSMAFGSQKTKLQRLAFLAAIFSFSAYRAKDYFRFIGYTNEVELGFPEPRDKDYPYELARAILSFDWRGRKRGGLLRAAQSIPSQRSLVVILSDQLGKLDGTEATIRLLSDHHEVLPIIIWDPRELGFSQENGLLPLKSLETGEEGDLLLDPFGITRRALERNIAKQKRQVEEIFRRYGIKPEFFTEIEQSDIEALVGIFLAKRARL